MMLSKFLVNRYSREVLILGSGPSSRVLFTNLQRLKPGLDVFGMGLQIRYYPQLDWWPNYWALTDSKVVFSHLEELKALLRLAPPEMVAFLPSEVEFRSHLNIRWVPHSSTGGFALSEVSGMGYRKVYLIGVEGHYIEKFPQDSELSDQEKKIFEERLGAPPGSQIYRTIISPSFNPNYFADTYHQPGDIFSKPLGDSHRRRIQREIERARREGVKIFDLAPLSVLPVKRKSLEAIISSTVPVELGPQGMKS